MDKKTIIIIILSLAFAVVSWIAFKTEPVSQENDFIEAQINALQDENNRLHVQIMDLRVKSARSAELIDSLQSLKPKIVIKYEDKFKYIDGASANSIAVQFAVIFSDTIN